MKELEAARVTCDELGCELDEAVAATERNVSVAVEQATEDSTSALKALAADKASLEMKVEELSAALASQAVVAADLSAARALLNRQAAEAAEALSASEAAWADFDAEVVTERETLVSSFDTSEALAKAVHTIDEANEKQVSTRLELAKMQAEPVADTNLIQQWFEARQRESGALTGFDPTVYGLQRSPAHIRFASRYHCSCSPVLTRMIQTCTLADVAALSALETRLKSEAQAAAVAYSTLPELRAAAAADKEAFDEAMMALDAQMALQQKKVEAEHGTKVALAKAQADVAALEKAARAIASQVG